MSHLFQLWLIYSYTKNASTLHLSIWNLFLSCLYFIKKYLITDYYYNFLKVMEQTINLLFLKLLISIYTTYFSLPTYIQQFIIVSFFRYLKGTQLKHMAFLIDVHRSSCALNYWQTITLKRGSCKVMEVELQKS